MINIYEYLDSKDIREFHEKRKTVFSPTMQAIIVNKCETIPVEQKLKLLEEILESNAPETFTSDYCDDIGENAYEYISTSLNYKKKALDKIKEESSDYIFTLETSEISNGRFYGLSNEGYFSSFDKAYQSIVEYYDEFKSDEGFRLYSIITRERINSYESPTVCIFNNTIMIDIQAKDDPTFFDYAEFGMDVPFSVGDIVKYKSISRGEFYGVLSTEIRKNGYPNKIGNFGCSLDCFNNDDERFYYTESTPCIYLEKCSVSELPENQRILLALSIAYKDNKKFISILIAAQEHSLDELAKQAYVMELDRLKWEGKL